MDELSVELLTAIAAGALSFFFAYFPGVKTWFDGLDKQWKPLVNAGVLFVAAVGYLLVSCNVQLACIELTWQAVALIWVKALIANQGAYFAFVRQPKKKAQALEASKVKVQAILRKIERQ